MTPPSLSEFTAAAREYCLLAEQDEPLGDAGLWKIRDLLLRLIYHISSVDDAPQEPAENYPEVAEEVRRKVIQQFGGLVIGGYWFVFEPFNLEAREEPGMGVLSDDLADIYVDLVRGLAHANRGQMQEACFEWSLGYRMHWGQHATHALMAIESYRIANQILPGTHADALPRI